MFKEENIMNKKLSFRKYFKQYGEKGVCSVATDYATLADSVTIYVLSEKYNISKGAVRSAIRYTVENCLVSYSVANKMKAKAHRNQKRHTDDADSVPTSSDRYYDRLFKSRDDKIVTSLKSQINEISGKLEEYTTIDSKTPEELKKKESLEKDLRNLEVLLSDFLKKN